MDDNNTKALEMALDCATSWFHIHAAQRLKLFNFYIALLAVFVTGFITLLKEGMHEWELLVSLCLMVVTFSFKKLDQRTASLIKNAEIALEQIEDIISSATGIEQIKLIRAANQKISGQLSYRQIFNIIFLLGCGLGLLGVVIAIYPWICSAQVF